MARKTALKTYTFFKDKRTEGQSTVPNRFENELLNSYVNKVVIMLKMDIFPLYRLESYCV